MFHYKPPKELRALFIAHYAPLLLIIFIGPLTAFYGAWEIPTNKLGTVILGLIIFFLGSIIYFRWSLFWHRTYQGQLVTDGAFKRIRHPHYVSILIVGFGLAFFFHSLFALVLAFIAIPIMVWSIIDEEKLLVRQYGVAYQEYMRKVPWRIIPKIF